MIKKTARDLSLVFSGGGLGGLLNGLVVWLFGALGITSSLGVAIEPPLTPEMLYQKVVWGGIWGVLFLLPIIGKRVWIWGLALSIGPTLVQLLVVFPLKTDKGVLGLELGILTPVFVIFFNAVWGLVAAYWIHLVRPERT